MSEWSPLAFETTAPPRFLAAISTCSVDLKPSFRLQTYLVSSQGSSCIVIRRGKRLTSKSPEIARVASWQMCSTTLVMMERGLTMDIEGHQAISNSAFDASASAHRFAIEWDPCEIRWLVDGALVHRRVVWDPTPIPHLPMTLHVNTWPSRSREFAGRLGTQLLPATTVVRSISIEASRVSL